MQKNGITTTLIPHNPGQEFHVGFFDQGLEPENKEHTMNLFVGNLSWDVTQDELESSFGAYGNVGSCKIMMDRETGKPRGFAFVEMSNDADAQKAIQALHGREFKGRALNVNEARPREARPRPQNNRW